jgi:hypothetical protein
MKTKREKKLERFVIKIILMFSLALIISCSSVFFDNPQPTDSRNLKYVPKEIQGTWKKISKDYEESITIEKTAYHKVDINKNRLSKAKADTSKNYKIENGKIYLLKDDINIGYPYKLLNDTIYYSQRSEESLVLSDSVLLRSAKNCYVLNLKKKNWWEIVFIQKMQSGEIQICYPIVEDIIKMGSQYNIVVMDSTKKDSTFFHASLKSNNIQNLINKNGDGILYVLKPDSTFDDSE